MTDAREAFRLLAERNLLSLMQTVEPSSYEDDEEDLDPFWALGRLNAFRALGLFTPEECDRWRSRMQDMSTEPVDEAALARLRQSATHYLDAALAEVGADSDPPEIKRLSTAIAALRRAGLVSMQQSLRYQSRLLDASSDQGLRHAFFESGGIVLSRREEGEPMVPAPTEPPQPPFPTFDRREILRVIPGPLATRSGFTIIGVELYEGGLVVHWHFLRPEDAPPEPPDRFDLDPEDWDEADRAYEEFSGATKLEAISDDAGTTYRPPSRGSSGWSSNRPRVSLGDSAFVPAVPAPARELRMRVDGEWFVLAL